MNTQSDALRESPLEVACRRRDLTRPAHALVSAARIVGEPLALPRAPSCRRAVHRRISDQHPSFGKQDTCRFGAESVAAARRPGAAIHHRRAFYHGDDFYRLLLLLSRCVVRRTSGSQHPVLEVAAGFRSHHRACQGQHSARGSSPDHLRHHRSDPVDHAAAQAASSCWPAGKV